MNDATLWWIAAGALVGLELVTGTFYLLMVSLGLAAAAVSAHLGATHAAQFVVAAVLGGGAVVVWHMLRLQHPPASAQANPDLNIDIGSTVHVAQWQADGTARVQFRGAAWSARHEGTAPPASGDHVIRAIDGATLVLTPKP